MTGYRILVVRNDALGMQLRGSCLARDGVLIQVSPSEQDAIEAVGKEPADLVLVDREGSAVSAPQFVRSVRGCQGCEKTRVVLLHDEPESTSATEFKLAGGDAVLARSLDPMRLALNVAQLLGLPIRRAERVPVQVLVKLELPHLAEMPFKSMFANTVDVSTAGVRIEAQHPLEQDARVRLHMVLPGTHARLSVEAVVRHVVDEMLMQYGLEFVDLGSDARETLDAFLHARGAA